MNRNTKRIYFLVYNNTVLECSTNLKDFYMKVKGLDIGYNYSLSTIRQRFLDKARFSHNQGERVYWLQRIENPTYI